jgi:hypothetical protein
MIGFNDMGPNATGISTVKVRHRIGPEVESME